MNECYINCSAVLEDYGDYYIKKGQNIKPVAVIETIDKDLLRCRNYGCNKNYKEEENSDDACAYHTGPPIFHDTMKCWSCCRDRKSYDFESFQKITGCAIGAIELTNLPPFIDPLSNKYNPLFVNTS